MTSWGTPPPSLAETLSETYEMQVGDTLYIERGDRVAVNSYKYSPDPTLLERETIDRLYNKIKSEGHRPLYIRVDVSVFSVQPPTMKTDVEIRYAFRIEHSSPAIITIAVTWAVVVLAALIIAWLTSPYWGPLFWRIAGYEPGEVPAGPNYGAGSPTMILLLIAVIFALYMFMGGKR